MERNGMFCPGREGQWKHDGVEKEPVRKNV